MNRRDFIKDSATVGATLAMALGAEELNAQKARTPKTAPPVKKAEPPQARDEDKPKGPPVKCAVLGLGNWGRKMLENLAKMGNAPVVAICDTYTAPVHVKKSQALAPNASFSEDYRKVLENPEVQAVFVATPTHKHKQMVLDALAAGKHVYCEAPLSNDLAEAKAIAKAALDAKPIFMPGLQFRSNGQHIHVAKFIKGRTTTGRMTYARAQWHKRDSWRQVHPDDARQRELNWRLSKETSLGLVGEIGIHQMDIATWFFGEYYPKEAMLPVAASGFGGIFLHNDGRDVADTVRCVLEYPNNISLSYDVTLTNSFEGAYELFYGANAAVLMRDQRAWMFREAQGDPLGWEVYARKDDYRIGEPNISGTEKVDTGIALVADATKQLARNKKPGELGADVTKTALYQSILAFLDAIRENKRPRTGPVEGYQATVVAAKVNEAVLTGTRVVFQKEWFEIS
jgi:predicted dehydrogenase